MIHAFLAFILFILVSFICCQQILPYKHSALRYSYFYSDIPLMEYELTFQVELQIDKYSFFLVKFASSAFPQTPYGLYDCGLVKYEEKLGAYMNSKDLGISSEVPLINLISSFGSTVDLVYFKLSQTLLPDSVYQLFFHLESRIDSKYEPNFVSLLFVSTFNPNLKPSYTYVIAQNKHFEIMATRNVLLSGKGSICRMDKKYTSDYMNEQFNLILETSIPIYESASLTKNGKSIQIINEMVKNLKELNKVEWDRKVYPDNINTYPGFKGNLILEISPILSLVTEFSEFKILVPNGWELLKSNCISVSFLKADQNDNLKEWKFFEHTKCTIINNEIIFVNIEPIKNVYLRINITNVRNPIVPVSKNVSLRISNLNSKTIFLNAEIPILEVNQQNNVDLSVYSFTSDAVGKSFFISGNTQKIKISFKLLYVSLEKECLITINFKGLTKGFGPVIESCLIPKKNQGWIKSENVDCLVDELTDTLILRNILNGIKEDGQVDIYFLMKNENLEQNIEIEFNLFGKLENDNFHSEPTIKKSIFMQTFFPNITINDIYYLTDDNKRYFDANNVLDHNNNLTIKFSFPSLNYKIKNDDKLSLILHQMIQPTTLPLQCLIEELNMILPCNATSQINYQIISIFLSESSPNFFSGAVFTLKISGLFYSQIYENAYLFSFEYYLYFLSSDSKTYYISMKKAEIKFPILSPSPKMISLIGGVSKSSSLVSTIRFKLSSPTISLLEYSYLGDITDYKIVFFLKSFDLPTNCTFDFPMICRAPINSNINCTCKPGINPSSDNFYEWMRVEITEINLFLFNEYIDLLLINSDQPGEVAAIYYIRINQDFYVAIDGYKMEKRKDPTSLPNTKIFGFNWLKSQQFENKAIYPNKRVTSFFDLKIEADLFSDLKKMNTVYLMVYVDWMIRRNMNDEYPLECSFTTNDKLILDFLYLSIVEENKSLMIIRIDGLSLINENIFDKSIQCQNFITPYALKTDNLYFVTVNTNEGELLVKTGVSEASDKEKLSPGLLDVKRILVTPNNINIPSAHYAFYFENKNRIESRSRIQVEFNATEFTELITLTDFEAYLMLLPNNYPIPESWRIFNFDEFEYFSEKERRIPSDIEIPIRIQTKNCSFIKDENFFSLYIDLDIDDAINENSILLLELFGIPNPSITKVNLTVKIKEETKNQTVLISPPNLQHEFFATPKTSFYFEIDTNINQVHANGIIHYPMEYMIYIGDTLLHNYEIHITPSPEFLEVNKNNKYLFIDFEVKNLETDVDYVYETYFIYLVAQNHEYEEEKKRRFLQENDNSNIEKIKRKLIEENPDASTGNLGLDEVFLGKNPSPYRNAVVTKFYINEEGTVIIRLAQPSLSKKMVKVNLHRYLMKDYVNVLKMKFELKVGNKVIISKDQENILQNYPKGDIDLKITSKDIELENFESKLTVEISPKLLFDDDDEVFFGILYVAFNSVDINKKMMVYMNEDEVYNGLALNHYLVMALTKKSVGKNFSLTIPYLKKPLSNTTGELVISMLLFSSKNDIFCQNSIPLPKTQPIINSQSFYLIAIESIYFSDYNTFISDAQLQLVFSLNITELLADDAFRLYLPADFPQEVFYNSPVHRCNLSQIDNDLQYLKTITMDCSMVYRQIEIKIGKAFTFDQMTTVKFSLTIDNLFTTPNYGYVGSFDLIFFSLSTFVVKGLNIKPVDLYTKPIMMQGLSLINKVTKLDDVVDLKIIELMKGSIKTIYIKDFEGNGFKNSINMSIRLVGNEKIRFFNEKENSYNKTLQILNGDYPKKIEISVDIDSDFVIGYLIFKTTASIKKYQDIYPLKLLITGEKIKVFTPYDVSIIQDQGISSFLKIYLSERPNTPVTINMITSKGIKILGGDQIVLNSSYSEHIFRIKSQLTTESVSSIKYSINNHDVFELDRTLSNDTIIKFATSDTGIDEESLKFEANVISLTEAIDVNIKMSKFIGFIYYQISNIDNNEEDLKNENIIKLLEDNNSVKMNIRNNLIGLKECNQTKSICTFRIDKLDVSFYNVKIFISSFNNILSSQIYRTKVEVYPVKPLILDFGVSNPLPKSKHNDILCSLVDFLGISPTNIYSEFSKNCDLVEYQNTHARILSITSKINNYIEESKNLVAEHEETLMDMNVNTERIANLDPPSIIKLIANFKNAYDLITDTSNSASFKVYLFPSKEDPNMDMSIFNAKFDDLTKTSFFKSKYPMIDYDIYLKGSGILAGKDSYELIMPNILGIPITKYDNNSISLTLLLSDVAFVYGIALPINSKIPSNDQIFRGLDGDGNKVSSCHAQSVYNMMNNELDPLILNFANLNANTKYTLYYVIGAQIPGLNILSRNTYNVSASTIDTSIKKIGRRMLCPDLNENEAINDFRE